MTRTQTTALFLTLSLGGLACTPEPGTDDTGDTGDTDTGETGDDTGEQALTYWQDVAPIYYENCVTCHRDGGIAPFVLDDYQTAATWAELSATSAEDRVMPPWLVTDDGTCNSWQHSPTLSDEQIATIRAWVDAGAPEGTPRDDLELPDTGQLDATATYMTPEFVPMPEGGLLSKFDEYRCFLIDPQLDHDMFMTGYEVTPGNDALVHHMLAMPVDPELVVGEGLTNLDVITALDNESPDRDGWPCFGLAGDNVTVEGVPVTWAPGQGVVELPNGSGARIGAGNLLVVQIHYNMVDAELIGMSDSSALSLRLTHEVEREGVFDLGTGLLNTMFEGEPHIIPAGEERHDFSWRLPAEWYTDWLGSDQVELWGVFPHMHEYGIEMSVRLLDDQGQDVGCVADVPRWDFGWQLYYFMQQPLVLERGHELEITCTYDTTKAPTDVWPGWGTFNEMCLLGVYLVGG